jgi:hypothetical protein
MNDIGSYTVQLRGPVSAGELNAMSPIDVEVTPTEAGVSLLTFSTDQSGLLGLLSYLHGLGFVFLAVNRTEMKEGV